MCLLDGVVGINKEGESRGQSLTTTYSPHTVALPLPPITFYLHAFAPIAGKHTSGALGTE
jgi:hypothetical protein